MITSADIMTTYRSIIANGMNSGEKFQQKYFNAISGCVHAVYRYAMTFEGLPIIDLPKSLDYSMLSFRQTEQRNDDILAKALIPEQLKRAFEWCGNNSDDLPVLALWLNFYLALRFAELYALR